MMKHIITYTLNGIEHRHVTADDKVAFVAINNAKRNGAENIGMCEEETDEPDTL